MTAKQIAKLKRGGLIAVKVLATIVVGLVLTTLFAECFLYELDATTDTLTFIGFVAALVAMSFCKPLREIVFGEGKFLKFILQLLCIVVVWYIATAAIGSIVIMFTHYMKMSVSTRQIYRISGAVSVFICYLSYYFFLKRKKCKEIVKEGNC